MFYFDGFASSVFISNETATNSKMDDILYILNSISISMDTLSLSNVNGTGSITSSSGIIKFSNFITTAAI